MQCGHCKKSFGFVSCCKVMFRRMIVLPGVQVPSQHKCTERLRFDHPLQTHPFLFPSFACQMAWACDSERKLKKWIFILAFFCAFFSNKSTPNRGALSPLFFLAWPRRKGFSDRCLFYVKHEFIYVFNELFDFQAAPVKINHFNHFRPRFFQQIFLHKWSNVQRFGGIYKEN